PGVVRLDARLHQRRTYRQMATRRPSLITKAQSAHEGHELLMSDTITLRGRKVVGGRAEGEALVTRDTVPGWGGVNPVQAVITEVRHELRGVSFASRILVCRGAKGSSGWSAMFHTARLAGTAPKA